MATKLELKTAELTEKRNRLAGLFDAHKGPEGLTLSAAQVDEVKGLNTELNALGKEVKDLRDLDEIETKNRESLEALNTPARTVPFGHGGKPETKGTGTDGASAPARPDLGKLFVESKGFQGRSSGMSAKISLPDLEVKTLFQTSAGWAPFSPRIGHVALSPQQQPRIVDVFPAGSTGSAVIKYMQETTYTNAADWTAEAAQFPESALALTEVSVNVVKLSTFLPVTDEQLEDVDGARDYINSRMELMMGQRLDSQLLAGDGTGSNLLGLDAVSGIQTRAAAGADETTDTLLKAIVDVQATGFAEPSAILMHPTDWMNVRLLKTADGIYIWGHPSTVGTATMWGLPVVSSTYVTAGTARVGDFKGQSQVFHRKGLEFLISNSHSDFFIKGKQAIRCDQRVVLVVFRPTAFVKVTGL